MCNGPFISPDSNHSSRNSTFSKQHFSPRDDQHGGKPSCPPREGGREGGEGGEGREGRGGEGRGVGEGRGGEGRAGQGRAGEGRAGQGRAGEGEGRGGEGRGGEGRGLSTLSTNQNLCDRGA